MNCEPGHSICFHIFMLYTANSPDCSCNTYSYDLGSTGSHGRIQVMNCDPDHGVCFRIFMLYTANSPDCSCDTYSYDLHSYSCYDTPYYSPHRHTPAHLHASPSYASNICPCTPQPHGTLHTEHSCSCHEPLSDASACCSYSQTTSGKRDNLRNR